jgi:hypothetical protein
MATSEVYTDVVGSVERNYPRAYDTCIHRDCPNCGAVPFQMCMISPAKTRRAPCIARMH